MSAWSQKAFEYFDSLGEDMHDLKTGIVCLQKDSYKASVSAGWRQVGETVNVPMSIALMHSELSEMLEGDRRDFMDEHLHHRTSVEVEAADLLIRLMDFAGAMGLDLAGAYVEKRAYNAQRADHKKVNREKVGGKRY